MFLTLCLNGAKIEVTKHFYERLGYSFEPEQHGPKGLPHYLTVVPSVPVEIYPSLKGFQPSDHLFIGFNVDDPVAMKAQLISKFGGSEELSVPTTKSGIATLRDPNGTLVRLFPKP